MISTTSLPVNNFAAVARTAANIFGVVVHCTAGSTLDGEIQAFQFFGTSAHYTIDRDGTIFSHVPEESVAFHVAAFGSKPKFNREENRPTWLPPFDVRFSRVNAATVGIELIGFPDTGTPETDFTDQQYVQLADLIADICQRQNIPIRFRMDAGNDATIVAHRDLQNDKSDPGVAFDFPRLKALLIADGGPRTIEELEVRNPNIRRQLAAWQKGRVLNGEEPLDYPAFRDFQIAIGAPDPGPAEFVGFRRLKIEVLEGANPQIRQQLADWQELRVQHGDDPLNYSAFRAFQIAIGAPDPSPDEFIGFLRPTLGELAAFNPNIGQQLVDWRQMRIEQVKDPVNYLAFRQFQIDIGAPDPGLTEFSGFRA